MVVPAIRDLSRYTLRWQDEHILLAPYPWDGARAQLLSLASAENVILRQALWTLVGGYRHFFAPWKLAWLVCQLRGSALFALLPPSGPRPRPLLKSQN